MQKMTTLSALEQAHDSASLQDETSTWQEEYKESVYANNLPQLEAGMGRWGRSIPKNPDDWECDETGVKDNLWLNLSTGFIGSGRQARRTLLPSCKDGEAIRTQRDPESADHYVHASVQSTPKQWGHS